jgi:hypothetical protein
VGSTPAVVGPALLAALRRRLSPESRTIPPPTIPGVSQMAGMEHILRALAILAELRDAGPVSTSTNTSAGGTMTDPMALKPGPDPLKLPGLFGDVKLAPPSVPKV